MAQRVTTFNFHPHLPHYAVTTDDTKSIVILAKQPIDLTRPHPFTEAGNREFNCFLWMPPAARGLATSCWPTRQFSRPCSAARRVRIAFGATSLRGSRVLKRRKICG